MSRLIEDCNILEDYEESVIPAKRRPVANFSAGPAKLPEEVLWRAQMELREYKHTGISILEMSHRSKDFDGILNSTKKLFRDLMEIPADYDVLFVQGGGTGQFAAVPLNLMRGHSEADYLVTGSWSAKALSEAGKYLQGNRVINPPFDKYTRIPPSHTWKLSPQAAYVYYCANETINGVEFHEVPDTKWDIPLVSDMSSNILSKRVNVAKHGLIYAGTQKNIGTAGLTVVIVRKDLIGDAAKYCPSIFDYKAVSSNNSVLNTPPTYSIYLTKLVLEWIKEKGGIDAIAKRNQLKAQIIYDVIDDSYGFYHCPIDMDCRSFMNIPFRIGSPQGIESFEKDFIDGAEQQDMISLKGHRSVGGVRASLYNAVSPTETEKLADYMRAFMEMRQEE